MAFDPGTRVDYQEPADGTWHPGTVKFVFCDLSVGGPFTLVIDEVGWGHNCPVGRARIRQDRADLRDFKERPPAARKS